MEQIIIRDCPQYKITISPEKNRAYLKIVGYWRAPESVPDYLDDWRAAVKQLKKGFTLLTDASEMKTHPSSVRSLHEQAQKIVMEAGLAKVAELMGADEIAEMQLDSVAKTTRFPKQNFKSKAEAEVWLDS